MLWAAFIDKKGLMPVWRPRLGLPECERTSVNKRQTYTNTPAAIGPSQGEECVGDAKQQQQQGELQARVPLFHSFTNQEEAPPQEGAWKDGSLTKNAFGGVHRWPRPGLNACKWESILTHCN